MGQATSGTPKVSLAVSLQGQFQKLPQGASFDLTQQGEVRCGSLTLYTVPSTSPGPCPWSSGLCLLNPQNLPGCFYCVSTWFLSQAF